MDNSTLWGDLGVVLFCNYTLFTKWCIELANAELLSVTWWTTVILCADIIPAEPAWPTFSCTSPGIVQCAVLPLRARGWLTVHVGSGRAVTPLRASRSPWYLPNLQRTVSHCWVVCVTQLFSTDHANKHNGEIQRWGILGITCAACTGEVDGR